MSPRKTKKPPVEMVRYLAERSAPPPKPAARMTDARLDELSGIYHAAGRGLASVEQFELLAETRRARASEKTKVEALRELRTDAEGWQVRLIDAALED